LLTYVNRQQKGLTLIADDFLLCPHHLARTVMENSSETLNEKDMMPPENWTVA